jgi:hypothetical protein
VPISALGFEGGVYLKVMCYHAEKLFPLSKSIEKWQHFEVSFEGKTTKNSDF